jgi:hypothetical protein
VAGGISKFFGGLFLVFGALLLVAGIIGAVYASTDERENQEGFFDDPERSDQNEAILYGSAAAGALGLVLLVLGVIGLSAGSGLQNRAVTKAIRELKSPTQDAGPEASKTANEASSWKPSEASWKSDPAQTAAGQAEPDRRRRVAVFVVLGVLLATVAVLAIVAGMEGSGPLSGLEEGSGEFEPVVFQGTVRQAFSLAGMGNTADSTDSEVQFTPSAGASLIAVQLEWVPADVGGAEQLEVILEQEVAGVWSELNRGEGTSGFLVESEFGLEASALRIRVFPAGDSSFVSEQEFTAIMTFAA